MRNTPNRIQAQYFLNALLLSGTLSLLSSSLALPAHAGGGDSPDEPTEATIENSSLICEPVSNQDSANQSKRKCKQRPRLTDWRDWNAIHSDGKNFCREHNNGNIVCLSPAQAQQLRW